MKTILKVENLKKYYGEKGAVTKAVDGISFEIYDGDFVGIMGASGSGKTTLLNCVSTIDKPTDGHIFIDGKDVTELNESSLSQFRRKKLGFVFQDFNLLDTLTSFENIALALTIIKAPPAEIESKVNSVAEILDITDVLAKYPYQISGGQKQRVAAARAIVTNPSLILADEPTGALDSKSAETLLESFNKLNKTLNASIMLVTHDAFTASRCKRILFIKDGKVFDEISRGNFTCREFYERISEVVSRVGGDLNAF